MIYGFSAFLQKYDEAAAQIDYVLARKPRDPIALNLSGSILAASGQKEKAIQQFEAAIAADPDNEEFKANLQRAKSGG